MTAVLTILLSGCVAPDNGYLMELNRNGKWKEAERIGLDMLRDRRTFTHSETCETYFHVIYAETRMGKRSDAVRLMKEYDDFRGLEPVDPGLLWLGREMARLKMELGLLTDVQFTLVTAMEENGAGNYAAARELCGKVLDSPEADDIQRATAHFVAAVCSIRLGDAVTAGEHLAAFDLLKSALPPGHQALTEEEYARRGLRELIEREGK